jgi:hypothetical protein
VAQPGENVQLVLLDLLPRRAAVALLAPAQIGLDLFPIDYQPGR